MEVMNRFLKKFWFGACQTANIMQLFLIMKFITSYSCRVTIPK